MQDPSESPRYDDISVICYIEGVNSTIAKDFNNYLVDPPPPFPHTESLSYGVGYSGSALGLRCLRLWSVSVHLGWLAVLGGRGGGGAGGGEELPGLYLLLHSRSPQWGRLSE